MSSESPSHDQDGYMLLGKFQADISNLKSGLKRAEALLAKTAKDLEEHSSNAGEKINNVRLELETIRVILKSQTDRVTELLEETASNSKWIVENGSLIEVIEDHEDRINGLEHNRTFIKAVIWLSGIVFTLVTATPLLKKIFEWLGK